jgi:hypothetical protein
MEGVLTTGLAAHVSLPPEGQKPEIQKARSSGFLAFWFLAF